MRKGGGDGQRSKEAKSQFFYYNLANAPKNIPPSIKPPAPYMVRWFDPSWCHWIFH